MQSPPKPWIQGKQPTYTAFQLVVNVCQDEFGNIWSDHEFLTPEGEQLAQGLPHGGVAQIAHALLTETVRREVFTCALVWMSKDPRFLERWALAEPPERKFLEEELVRAAQHVVTATTTRMLPGAVAGVLDMLAQQGGFTPITTE